MRLHMLPEGTTPGLLHATTPGQLSCSIGIMAYNEEANIAHLLKALLAQQTVHCDIKEIIVLASGCKDNTEGIVRAFCHQHPHIKLIVQPRREGKASAINLF